MTVVKLWCFIMQFHGIHCSKHHQERDRKMITIQVDLSTKTSKHPCIALCMKSGTEWVLKCILIGAWWKQQTECWQLRITDIIFHVLVCCKIVAFLCESWTHLLTQCISFCLRVTQIDIKFLVKSTWNFLRKEINKLIFQLKLQFLEQAKGNPKGTFHSKENHLFCSACNDWCTK